MELKGVKNLLMVTALGITLLNIGLMPNKASLSEGAIDFDNNQGVKLDAKRIGSASSDEILTSNMYSQYGQDNEGNYCLRFAVAVAGQIESIRYVRAGIEGVGDGQDKVVDVETVYKAIMSDGLPTYYDADNEAPTTSDVWAGSYYWACYTIRYHSSKYYKQQVSVSLFINEQEVGTKTASLYSQTNGVLKYSLGVEEGYIGEQLITSGKFEGGTEVGLTATKVAPEGKQIAGWYNVENKKIVSKDPTKIVMPEYDVNIAPYADGIYIDPLSSIDPGIGKVDLNTYLLSEGGMSLNTWQGKSTVLPTITPSIINGEGGKLYTLDSTTDLNGDTVDAIVEGDFVIPMTAYKMTPIDHTFTFTFENQGESTVEFKLYLVNASSNAATVPDDATLVEVAPGELVSVEASCTDFTNNNILPVMYFTKNITNFRLGAYAYCTYVADHECLNACELCGKCKNESCTEAVCAEKCETIMTKSVVVNTGKDFFKSSNWETCPSNTSANPTARGERDLYSCQYPNRLVFTNATASRFDLFYAKAKPDGSWGINIADNGATNIEANNATDIYGVDHEYEVTMSSNGELDIMIFGSKNSSKGRGDKNAIYMNIATDGKVTIYHTSATANFKSLAEFSGSSTFKFDGTDNKVKFNLIRESQSVLKIMMTVNGQVVQFAGTSAYKNTFNVSDNYFTTTGVVTKQGFGQRFGIIPIGESCVTISDLIVNIG